MSRWEELEKCILRGKIKNCIEIVGTMPKKERRIIRPALKKMLSKEKFYSRAQEKAIVASTLFAGKLSDFKKWYSFPDRQLDADLLLTSMKKYPRDEFRNYANYAIKKDMLNWKVVYRMVKEGITDKPDSEEYYIGAFNGFGRNISKVDDLLNDKEFLENDLWKLILIEGQGESSFAAHDKYTCDDACWNASLIKLVNSGHINRRKFIASLLEALSYDFSAFRAQWHIRVLKDLSLSSDELVRHKNEFIALLGSTTAQIVAFAVKCVEAVNKYEPMRANELIKVLEPAMYAKQKTVISTCVKLLSKAFKAEPQNASNILQMISLSFLHESVDIHKKAVDILEKNRTEITKNELAEIVFNYKNSVAPSIKNRLYSLAPVDPLTITDDDFSFVPTQNLPQKLEIINNVEELAEQTSYFLENWKEHLLFEQLLDGYSRIGAIALADHKSLFIPLIKRITPTVEEEWEPQKLFMPHLLGHLLGLEVIWKKKKRNNHEPEIPEKDFLHHRVKNLSNRISHGKALPLLSFPSYEDGHISAIDLNNRLINTPAQEIDRYDFILALLRLEKSNRETLHQLSRDLEGFYGHALKYALGITDKPVKDKELWLCSFIARENKPDTSRLPSHFLKALNCLRTNQKFEWEVRTETNTYETKSYTFYAIDLTAVNNTSEKKREIESIYHISKLLQPGKNTKSNYFSHNLPIQWEPGWRSILIPSDLENYFASAIPWMSRCTREVQVEDIYSQNYLLPLLYTSTPSGEMGSLLTVLALGSGDSSTRIIATDIIITLIDDGRMEPELLGAIMSTLIQTNIIVLGRWAKCLGEIITISNHHAKAIAEIVQHSLRGDINKAPRDLGKYLDLLQQALALSGENVNDPQTIEYFSNNKRGGKVKKIIKELVEIVE